ncbi:MAG TPA: ATP-dependent DNA ligase, partial [Isosphaeraceae bacterium]|nr:ATP-dependent DNA ligase [Isosphaeraceae bacterium]
LSGRKPRQVVPTKLMRQWAMEEGNVPEWLFGESYDAVGDLSETIALVLPGSGASSDVPLSEWVDRLISIRGAAEAEQRRTVVSAWAEMDERQRFLWNKLIGGSFRVGVSQQLVVRGLAKACGVDEATLTHRLMGHWEPTAAFFERLTGEDRGEGDASRPFPFFLAHPLEGEPATLGEPGEWQVEWKWDGIRAQLIRRGGDVYLWTRGEELVTERYPEIEAVGRRLSEGTVVDGEILPWREGQPMPFGQLQRRIGRKTVSKAILSEVPVALIAYDLMEVGGEDVREWPLGERRAALERVVEQVGLPERFVVSPVVEAEDWGGLAELRETSRERGAEGFMLKREGSPYRVGRTRGDWWKWKVNPYSIDAVLTAAQRGSGKRASLYTDYTFSVWDDGRLVPFAKAYSGLSDEEIRRVDAFVRKNMKEKFGPVRTVAPVLVFELGFEGIQRSTRHRSGVAVRFPRILRWREDKSAEEADSLETIRALLPAETRADEGEEQVLF